METAILVVWWIGLLGALVATRVILKEVALVVRALRDINRLAEFTRDAARGVATNVEPASRLAGVGEPADTLATTTGSLTTVAASIERRLQALAEGG
jgi:hypothetical protein